MFSAFIKWASFVKFSHTIFALPFALASMVVAARDQRGWPGWRTFGLILVAMLCARTCAMAFNRIVDREFDRENPRTANRHLPTGQISLASPDFAFHHTKYYASTMGTDLIKRFLVFEPIVAADCLADVKRATAGVLELL